MSIDVLWTEVDWDANVNGPAPSRVLAAVHDEYSLVARFLANLEANDFPYLSFISLGTMTVFHQRHLAQLISELRVLCERKHDAQVEAHLHAVLRFVSAARDPKDTSIEFRVRQATVPAA